MVVDAGPWTMPGVDAHRPRAEAVRPGVPKRGLLVAASTLALCERLVDVMSERRVAR